VRHTGGPNERLVEVLLRQHARGREITDYLAGVAAHGRLPNDTAPLADALAGMARMYQAHAAWEDTVVFPAWKHTQSRRRLQDLAERFEEIEHRPSARTASTMPSPASAASSRGWGLPTSRRTRQRRRPCSADATTHAWA
jgi:hemerythrin-like domain-containing protein